MSVSKMISNRQYNKRRSIVSDRTIRILVIVVLLLITGIILYPLYFVLIASISDPNYVKYCFCQEQLHSMDIKGFFHIPRYGERT